MAADRNIILFNIYVLFFSLLLSSCANKPLDNHMTEDAYELPQSCNFTALANNSGLRSECSPELKGGFLSKYQGIVINGPAEVIWPKGASIDDMMVMPNGDTEGALKLVIAGVLQLPNNLLGKVGDLAEHVVLVAVNQKTATSYSGKMLSFGFKGESPDISAFPDLVGQASLEYFSIDLVQNLEIPIENATYTVYATLGDFKSNTLTIKTNVK